MSRLVNAFEQFFDGAGDPLVSGLVDFFESGSSTTRKKTFADVSETIENPNPVVLGGDGRCPNVFGSGTYRAVLRTAGGTQILTRDPIGGVTATPFGADWSSQVIYGVTDVVRDDGQYWESLVNNNLNNRPSVDDGSNWSRAIIAYDDIRDLQFATDYGDLRSKNSSSFLDGDAIQVTDIGLGGQFPVKSGSVTDNGGTFIVANDNPNRYYERIVNRPVQVEWFGAVGDGVTDDFTAIQQAIDNYTTLSSRYIEIIFGENKTYRVSKAPIVKTGIVLNLNGSRLDMAVTGNEADATTQVGLRLTSYSGVKNGSVIFNSQGGSYASQNGVASAINMGSLLYAGTTTTPRDEFQEVFSSFVSNVFIDTNVEGKCGIYMCGTVSNVNIDNVVVPLTTTMSCAIQTEQSFFAPDDVNYGSLYPINNRTAYDLGTMYTRHPHNIYINNVFCGGMNRPYSSSDNAGAVLRILNSYNVFANNVIANSATMGIRCASEGMGFEFAQTAQERSFYGKTTQFSNISVKDCLNGVFAHHSTIITQVAGTASGIPAQHPYLNPLIEDAKFPAAVTYRNCKGGFSTNTGQGMFRVSGCRGVLIKDCTMHDGLYGLQIDDYADRVIVDGGMYYKNKQFGVIVSGTTAPPEDFLITGNCQVFNNGTNNISGQASGVYLARTTRPTVDGVQFGRASLQETSTEFLPGKDQIAAETQQNSIQVGNDCRGAVLRNNFTKNVKNDGAGSWSGIAYRIATVNNYYSLELFENNRCADYIPAANYYTGANIIPYASCIDPNTGIKVRKFKTNSLSGSSDTPIAGTWNRGDVIDYTALGTGAPIGTVCEGSGTVSSATDNTGDTDGSTRVITGMTDTSDFEIGQWVTITAGFPAGGPFRVMEKTADSLTLDAISNSAQTNVTVASALVNFTALANL